MLDFIIKKTCVYFKSLNFFLCTFGFLNKVSVWQVYEIICAYARFWKKYLNGHFNKLTICIGDCVQKMSLVQILLNESILSMFYYFHLFIMYLAVPINHFCPYFILQTVTLSPANYTKYRSHYFYKSLFHTIMDTFVPILDVLKS